MTYEQTPTDSNVCSTCSLPLAEARDDVSLYSQLNSFQRVEDCRSLKNYENIWALTCKCLQGLFIKPNDDGLQILHRDMFRVIERYP